MTGVIEPPIVVIEGWDFQFFDTIDDALSYIEPWYPNRVPDYRAFDRGGRRLELLSDPPIVERRILFGLLRADNAHACSLIIRAGADEPTGREDLLELLRGYLERAGQPARDTTDLDELWREASARA